MLSDSEQGLQLALSPMEALEPEDRRRPYRQARTRPVIKREPQDARSSICKSFCSDAARTTCMRRVFEQNVCFPPRSKLMVDVSDSAFLKWCIPWWVNSASCVRCTQWLAAAASLIYLWDWGLTKRTGNHIAHDLAKSASRFRLRNRFKGPGGW